MRPLIMELAAIQEIARRGKESGLPQSAGMHRPGLYKRGTTGKVTKVLEDAGGIRGFL